MIVEKEINAATMKGVYLQCTITGSFFTTGSYFTLFANCTREDAYLGTPLSGHAVKWYCVIVLCFDPSCKTEFVPCSNNITSEHKVTMHNIVNFFLSFYEYIFVIITKK